MKRLALLPLAALALAACSESATNPLAPEIAGPLFSHQNEINGPTFVIGSYAKQIASTQYVNTHPNAGRPAGGSCRDSSGDPNSNGPIWYNQGGNPTSNAFCVLGSGGSTSITCTFTTAATFTATAHDVTSGNQNLNFDVTKAVGYDATTNPNPDLFVHYNSNHNNTGGEGILNFMATCTGSTTESGTLNLNAFDQSGNPFSSYTDSNGVLWGALNTTGVQVTVGSNSYSLSGLTWDYRSGV